MWNPDKWPKPRQERSYEIKTSIFMVRGKEIEKEEEENQDRIYNRKYPRLPLPILPPPPYNPNLPQLGASPSLNSPVTEEEEGSKGEDPQEEQGAIGGIRTLVQAKGTKGSKLPS